MAREGGGNDARLYVQHDGEANEPFLGGGKLLALVDLLPKREVVVRAAVHVRLERDARRPVEHEVGYLRQRGSTRASRISFGDFLCCGLRLAVGRTMRYPRLTNVQLNCWVIPGSVSSDSFTTRTRHGCISQAPGKRDANEHGLMTNGSAVEYPCG